MNPELLKNGLTKDQSEKARALLIRAGIRRVARSIGTSDTAIQFVLNGNSKNIELLDKALREANKLIAERDKIIANLPLHG